MSNGNQTKGGQCWSCGQNLTDLDYGRGDTCPKCGRDTRVCKGCIFYDLHSNNQCREPQADRVVEKERSNFCDYFKPGGSVGGTLQNSRENLRSAAEALFKKK